KASLSHVLRSLFAAWPSSPVCRCWDRFQLESSTRCFDLSRRSSEPDHCFHDGSDSGICSPQARGKRAFCLVGEASVLRSRELALSLSFLWSCHLHFRRTHRGRQCVLRNECHSSQYCLDAREFSH